MNSGFSYLITAVCALGKCYKKGLQSCTKRVNRNSRAGNNYAITALLAETQTLDVSRDIVPEIIDSGPMCITELFQNKSVAYF